MNQGKLINVNEARLSVANKTDETLEAQNLILIFPFAIIIVMTTCVCETHARIQRGKQKHTHEKSQVAISFLKDTCTDPLEKQLDRRGPIAFRRRSVRPSVKDVDDSEINGTHLTEFSRSAHELRYLSYKPTAKAHTMFLQAQCIVADQR